MLQTATTVAAIALALATLRQDEGPTLQDVRLIPATLFLAGCVAVISSGHAIAALHEEIGLTRGDLIDLRRQHTLHGEAIIIATWALIILAVGYLWILVGIAP